VLRDLRDDFPKAPIRDLESLMLNGEVNTSQAARILGRGVSTVRYYTKTHFVPSKKNRQFRMLTKAALYTIRDKSKGIYTCAQASRKTGVLKNRIIYLARIGMVKHRHNRFGVTIFTENQLQTIVVQDKILRAERHERRSRAMVEALVKPEKDEITVKEAAKNLDVSPAALKNRIKARQLKAILRHGIYYIRKTDFEDFCRCIIDMRHAKVHLKDGARHYLESIAPN
jgi:DNA-binding transcriptional MerR regulator